MNSKLIGSKHPSLLIEVQINTCCQSTHLSSWQVATINPGADPIIPMNISQCPLARDAIKLYIQVLNLLKRNFLVGFIYIQKMSGYIQDHYIAFAHGYFLMSQCLLPISSHPSGTVGLVIPEAEFPSHFI